MVRIRLKYMQLKHRTARADDIRPYGYTINQTGNPTL